MQELNENLSGTRKHNVNQAKTKQLDWFFSIYF